MDYDDLSKLARSFQYNLIGFDELTDGMLSSMASLLTDAGETLDQYLWIESQYNHRGKTGYLSYHRTYWLW